ncbi:MAG: hypothetical protein Q9163_001333 [Psora crenata]
MLDSFTGTSGKTDPQESAETSTGETDATVEGVRSIAVDVLGSVAYGDQKSSLERSTEASSGHRMAYRDSIIAVVENIAVAALVHVGILTSPVMPKSIRNIGYAVKEFPEHVKILLARERASKATNTASFMSILVKLSDSEMVGTNPTSKKQFLTEDELVGSIFVFTVAGFDTTANTMAYAITLLACYPQWQDWIQEELDHEMRSKEGLDYASTFPVLERCLALMFEVLRLYTPVVHITRSARSTQEITTSSGTYHVPADTLIYISTACMHVNPAVWGADALSFRPTRWMSEEGSFINPHRASFLPWSVGPRVCPGQKMAQVEFVAVMMTLFRSYRVSPVVEEGKTIDMAREKLKGLMADSQSFVTLQMNRPRELKLKWEKR